MIKDAQEYANKFEEYEQGAGAVRLLIIATGCKPSPSINL